MQPAWSKSYNEITEIDFANLMTNLAQLDLMQRQLEHDRELHDKYYSTIISLLEDIRKELADGSQ